MNEKIPSHYQPKDTEEKWYRFWESRGLFEANLNPKKDPYSILIPPPNITGILHMGHALNNTLQDILIRFQRMKQKEALWMPGTDHAGIATQNVVERSLAREGKTRQELGREKFVAEVWKWKEERGGTIVRQLRKLGASCDWRRECFTLDEKLSRAVREVFVRLYKKGLIYRGDYIVNWCPRCQTALSDEEAPHRETEGYLYYLKYPVEESDDAIIVATTRPETMLGDTAVAVNPRDRRHASILNRTIILPLVGRRIPVIKDSFVDPEFGTGIVKVTPAHDPNDFEMGRRHNLERVLVMNPDGTMNKNAGSDYEGMDRFEAREAILEDLKERGLLLKVESHRYAVSHCYRCHTMIEPYLSRQWFVKMKPLAKAAIEAVRSDKIKFYPGRWTKVYLDWMENIRDWCISRQIWWGHRIPVWYCAGCNETIVETKEPKQCNHCGGSKLRQDEDVLDTWFSSWLWPFSTFGWPDKSKDLKYFYPTSCLVTAPEIIFFWVARMIMAGCEFMREVPFRDVYIHGTVRDTSGSKMSKSLGNIIDPLEVIAEVGADALRFSLISLSATGQDVFLSGEKFHIGRNFANKIWNASRFLLMNSKELPGDLTIPEDEKLGLFERWILSRLNQTVLALTRALENYRFNEAASIIYEFFWHQFCDWYIELAKPVRNPKSQIPNPKVLLHVLETSLRLLHPFMPFISEDIWQRLPHKEDSLMIASWPELDKKRIDKNVEREAAFLMELITQIRNLRAEMGVPHNRKVAVRIGADKKKKTLIESEKMQIERLAGTHLAGVERTLKKEKGTVTALVEGTEIFVDLKGIVELEKEKARLDKKIAEASFQLAKTDQKLKNKAFIKNAPGAVVEAEKKKAAEFKESIAKFKRYLKEI